MRRDAVDEVMFGASKISGSCLSFMRFWILLGERV